MFDKVKEGMEADLTIVNLESALLPSAATVRGRPGRIMLHGDASGAVAMRAAGVNVVSQSWFLGTWFRRLNRQHHAVTI